MSPTYYDTLLSKGLRELTFGPLVAILLHFYSGPKRKSPLISGYMAAVKECLRCQRD